LELCVVLQPSIRAAAAAVSVFWAVQFGQHGCGGCQLQLTHAGSGQFAQQVTKSVSCAMALSEFGVGKQEQLLWLQMVDVL
jgi:hypothetical protein